MKPGFLRTFALIAALGAGILVPQAYVAVWLVRWLIIGMLFVVFLQTRFSRKSLQPSHGTLLAANLAMGGVGWAIGWLAGGHSLALAGFFAGITPTATAAAVITGFLGGRIDYVVTAFMLTTMSVAAVFPFVLPWVLGQATPNVFSQVMGSVGILVFIPLAVAMLLRRIHPPAAQWPRRLSTVSFSAWIVALFLITSNASHFLRAQTEIPASTVWVIAAVSAAICVLNFGLGRLIGGREFSREASQALGQKNTSLTIYLALAYANPLVALGPTCYVLWHNLWNSWQLYRHREHDRRTRA